MLYPVHEMFHSFQGEGVHAGRSAFFVRLFGCPIHCPWCDSAGTWHPKFVPDHIQRIPAKDLVDEAVKSGACFMVVTGGEPTIHDLFALYEHAYKRIPLHLETCGAFEFPVNVTPSSWVTLSPKREKLPLAVNILCANEIKLIIESPSDILYWLETMDSIARTGHYQTWWLHPEWSHRNDPQVLGAITHAVKTNSRLRAGWQMHKLYQADLRDERSRPAVPLGGNPQLGY